MTRKTISVRRHIRKLPSGRRTQVVRHRRSIDNKLFKPSPFAVGIFPEVLSRKQELKIKKAIDMKERAILESLSLLPPPDQAELKAELKKIKGEKGAMRKLDQMAFELHKRLVKLRPLEKKFGKVPVLSIGNIDPDTLTGTAIAFNVKKRRFEKIKVTPKKITSEPLLKRRKG